MAPKWRNRGSNSRSRAGELRDACPLYDAAWPEPWSRLQPPVGAPPKHPRKHSRKRFHIIVFSIFLDSITTKAPVGLCRPRSGVMRRNRLIARKRSAAKRDPLPVPLNTRSIRRERHFTRLFFLLFFDQNYARRPGLWGVPAIRSCVMRQECLITHERCSKDLRAMA